MPRLGALNLAVRASAGAWLERRRDNRDAIADGMLEARGAWRAQLESNKNGPDKQKMQHANKL
jgi:hypothetical protein